MTERVHRIMLSPWLFLALALPILAMACLQLAQREWLDGAADLLVGVTFVLIGYVRSSTLRMGIRLGYEIGVGVGQHRAREAMYSSLREAQARGMTPLEWLEVELERDRGADKT